MLDDLTFRAYTKLFAVLRMYNLTANKFDVFKKLRIFLRHYSILFELRRRFDHDGLQNNIDYNFKAIKRRAPKSSFFLIKFSRWDAVLNIIFSRHAEELLPS